MNGKVWLNGGLLAAAAARIDPSDRGFTLGDGVFETVRVDAGVPCRLDRHLARLRGGASVLGIPLAWTDAQLEAAVMALIATQSFANAALRITLSRGPAPRGIMPAGPPAPTLLIAAGTLPAPPPPARVVIARTTCRNERSPLSRIKSLSYLDAVLARREADACGADDAILLDTRGRVAEATAANLFVRLGGALVTPPVDDGALPGIARAELLEAGRVRECTLWPEDLAHAEAAWLVNSLGIRPVAALDGRALNLTTALD